MACSVIIIENKFDLIMINLLSIYPYINLFEVTTFMWKGDLYKAIFTEQENTQNIFYIPENIYVYMNDFWVNHI